MRKTNLERNQLIYNFYFQNLMSISEISNKINLSASQVSRILSTFPEYKQEKNRRKEQNHEKHNIQVKEFIKNKRIKKQTMEKEIMNILHNQAAIELSYTPHISNESIRKCCLSAYEYNSSKKRFELKDDLVYSKDMPRIIKY